MFYVEEWFLTIVAVFKSKTEYYVFYVTINKILLILKYQHFYEQHWKNTQNI